MKCIVLAAGYAMRLYPLTKDKPKALLPIGKKLLLDYLVDEIATISQIDEIYIVSNHRFVGQFERWGLSAKERYPKKRIFVLDDGTDSNETRLGAIGDICYALDSMKIDDDLLVAASDNFFTFPLINFVEDFHRHGRDLLLGKDLGPVDARKRFAIATIDAENRICSLVEKPENPQSNIAVFALYLYRRDTVPMFKEYLAQGNNPDAPGHFPEWLYPRRDVRIYLFDGECVDIGTPASYEEVCARFGGE